MKTAAGVTYTYDGDGRRVSKSSGKLYWYGSGGEILAETNTSGTVTAEYVFFGGRRVAMLPSGSSAQYFVEDFLGSSRVVTTNTGTVCYDADFTPFGAERAYTNTCTQNAYKFEGKERDSETGNDDFGARYYTWRMGRWLSSDWSSVPAPVPYANLTNPQTLNLYSMVSDDPESFADLDGHEAVACGESEEYKKPEDRDAAAKTAQDQAQQTSPDPKLPVNTQYVLVVENDSGPDMGTDDVRTVEYDLHNAPDAKHPNGTPTGPEVKSTVISEHLSNKKDFTESSSNINSQFVDTIGPHGKGKIAGFKGTASTDRYFTVEVNGKQVGVVPILDRSGTTHLVDHIQVDIGNDRTILNGQRGPTDVQ